MSSVERLSSVRRALKARFLERDQLVDGVLLAVLARQHVLLLGPPGSAKSMLARALSGALAGKRRFEWLLTKFSTPEEIFGPVSLQALEAGRYERVTDGKLPRAEVAFLDEVFKANSAILNALLTILNERQFHQGTRVEEVPLEVLIAASNELPEEDELGALYDRFLLRFTVGYIEQDHRFARLLRLEAEDGPLEATLSPEDLAALRAAVAQVAVPDGVVADVIEIRRTLGREGVVASDRRYRQAMGVLRASAVLDGRDRVGTADLRWLEHVLWSDPEERATVAQVLAKVATGMEEDARRLLGHAKEIEAYARRSWPDAQSRSRATLEAHTKLHDLVRRLATMRATATERGRDVSRIDDISGEIEEIQRQLLVSQN